MIFVELLALLVWHEDADVTCQFFVNGCTRVMTSLRLLPNAFLVDEGVGTVLARIPGQKRFDPTLLKLLLLELQI